MPLAFIKSFMVAPKIKSLIFYYFSPIHNLGSYVSVIISVCYKNKTFRFQNSLAYPPVFLTDFADWAKSARSTSPPLWKVLSPYPCLWPTGMYNKYLLMYSFTSMQRKSCAIARDQQISVIRLVNSVLNLPYWQMNFF